MSVSLVAMAVDLTVFDRFLLSDRNLGSEVVVVVRSGRICTLSRDCVAMVISIVATDVNPLGIRPL